MLARALLQSRVAVRCAAPRALAQTQRRGLSTFFAESHEYCKVQGETGVVGITSFAASELGDIVFVDLPDVGDEVIKGETFGAVESVKAASDVYAPVSGTVTEVNEALGDSCVARDAEGQNRTAARASEQARPLRNRRRRLSQAGPRQHVRARGRLVHQDQDHRARAAQGAHGHGGVREARRQALSGFDLGHDGPGAATESLPRKAWRRRTREFM